MNLERFYNQIIDPGRKIFYEPIYQILRAVSFFYSTAMKIRSWCYYSGWLSSKKLSCRTVSVGNLTLGGTGKTPMTLWLARMLKAEGRSPVILSRGYKGTTQDSINIVCDGHKVLLAPEIAGDEPVMMAERLKDVPVLTGTDRYSLGLYAIQHFNADFLLLDDGYQYLTLKRDCNILLLDYANPFGNGHVFPSGYLREPVDAINRADAICLTRCSETNHYNGFSFTLDFSKPLVKTRMRLKAWVRLDTGERLSPEVLDGESVIAFCGIARPDDFKHLLEEVGVRIVSQIDFPDHHTYTKDDLSLLRSESKNVNYIATTEKDAVKIRSFFSDVLILYAEIDLDILEGEDFLKRSVLGLQENKGL